MRTLFLPRFTLALALLVLVLAVLSVTVDLGALVSLLHGASVPGMVAAAAVAPGVVRRTISPEGQHVMDALEAHQRAIEYHARTGSDGANAEIRRYSDQVLARLKAWGLKFRADTSGENIPADESVPDESVPGEGEPEAPSTGEPSAPSAEETAEPAEPTPAETGGADTPSGVSG